MPIKINAYKTVEKSFAFISYFIDQDSEVEFVQAGISKVALVEMIESRQRYEELTVVALWSVFERYLIEKTQFLTRQFDFPAEAQCDDRRPSRFAQRLQDTQALKLEYWKFDEILDCYKELVGASEIGKAKQIKQYRDWIVHKNPRKRSSLKIDPTGAYTLLESIVSQIENLAPGEA